VLTIKNHKQPNTCKYTINKNIIYINFNIALFSAEIVNFAINVLILVILTSFSIPKAPRYYEEPEKLNILSKGIVENRSNQKRLERK
jgi:hypothetical protein